MNQPDLVTALERISVGAVGLTALSLSRALPGVELTLPQWRALLIVGDEADGTRIGTVASRVHATVPATSRLLRRLEVRGLVSVAPDETDGRARRARLTARGRRARAAIVSFRREILDGVASQVAIHDGAALDDGLAVIATELGKYA